MSPLIIKHGPQMECSVSRAGIGMVQAVVEKAGWSIGDQIEVGFIEKATCMLLRSLREGEGFKLAYANQRKKTGGRVFCVAFIRNYLNTIVRLPIKGITPVFPKGSEWDIALLLKALDWTKAEFSKNGSTSIPKDATGVYELVGNNDAVLRIGEGKIRDRINAHLKDKRFTPPTAKNFRFLPLDDPTDGQILERILIEQYETETGVLPRFQEIRA